MDKAIKISRRILVFTLIVFMGVALLGTSLTADAKKKSSNSTYTAGDNIAFGTLDGKIINWTILNYDDSTQTALVISKYSLSSQSVASYKKAINQVYANNRPGYVRWQDSYWRGWCNQIFYKNCFNDAEKAKIQKTTLSAEAAKSSIMNFYHDTTLDAYYVTHKEKNSLNLSIYDTQTATTDYIFFLSYDEYAAYKDTIVYDTNNLWPLRTNSYDDPAQGLYVNERSMLIQRGYYYTGDAIRPAMYIKLGNGETTDSSSTKDSSKTTSSTTNTSTTNTATTTATKTTSTATATTTAKTTTSTKKASSKSYANNGTDVGSIKLPDTSQYSMSTGSTAQAAIDMAYLNSTDKQYTVTYKSSDSNVFTVDSSGVVSAVGKGTGTLTVRMKKSNGKVYTMTCRIDVT